MTTHKRSNGFTWPPDKAQVVSWFFLFYFGLMFFGIFCASMAEPWSYIFGSVFSVFYVLLVFLIILVTAINPGEEVSLKRKITPKKDFSRENHKHVIENQFCNICQIVV